MNLFERERVRYRADIIAGRFCQCATTLIYTVLNRYARRYGNISSNCGEKLFMRLAGKYVKYPDTLRRTMPNPPTWPRSERKRWHANSKSS